MNRHWITLPCVTLLLLAAGTVVAENEEKFVPLFNGENLDGWVQNGGEAEYTVEDGVIIGTSVPKTPNSFLCTEKKYGDFILEVEYMVDPLLNSGIQIRSNVYDEPKTYKTSEGKEVKVGAGRVHGYQVEIDPSDRAWSGGIYDEGRRGWLFDLKNKPEAQKAFKQNEWNKYRIECRGNSIKTWINGVPAADLTDDMTAEGFIALQVHGVGGDEKKVGKQIKWRNVNIIELND
ncbi:DUF1080 domain-containing protein [Blastopirellula marina]|uniref:DUF1080 domain-containing protein n=1 Tax=Blastopirellula marina TaxID=124 RepID=A0A2S8F3E7_9BACT|nr:MULTISPECIES: DUF1080 domain-containing protein [Pirellulaceae]PQO26685.1 DUF1080 domain-containing protein [Blastopirellula marina]RCS46164.1 DUF1080 domain-containing protein [Bremerella cremea]